MAERPNEASAHSSSRAPGTPEADEHWMRHALALARNSPSGANPRVAALIVSAEGALLASGWHHGAGTPHAEPTALADAARRGHAPGSSQLAEATMYVTLEPCNHTGRTGPCSHAVTEAGVGRLVYAQADTTDTAQGGAAYLEEHGISVLGGVLAEESAAINARWLDAVTAQRPFVTAKLATSLDFRSVAADGRSQWITSEQSRQHAQQLRRTVDAVVIGTGTALADDPALTARTAEGVLEGRQPLRVVVGRREIPESARIRIRHSAADSGFLQIAEHDPDAVLRQLWERGCRHIMLEGGPVLIGNFLDSDRVDELWHYQAPLLLPGGAPAAASGAQTALADAARWHRESTEALGPDTFTRYTR